MIEINNLYEVYNSMSIENKVLLYTSLQAMVPVVMGGVWYLMLRHVRNKRMNQENLLEGKLKEEK